jgi:hypothetical protein
MEKPYARKLSPNQWAVMKAIGAGETLDIELVNNGTLSSLCQRKYIVFDGREEPIFTQTGLVAYETYVAAKIPVRKKAGEVTKYIKHMLRLKRAAEK